MKIYTVIRPGDEIPEGPVCAGYYVIDEDGELKSLSPPPRAEIMGISGNAGPSDPERVSDSISRECRERSFSGVFLRFRGPQEPLLRALEKSGLELFYTDASAYSEKAAFALSSRLSGGSFERMLSEGVSRVGGRSLCLWCRPFCSDYSMPAHSAEGERITPGQARELMKRHGADAHLSPEMLCKYFTYETPGGVRYCLFDDRESIEKKLEAAQSAGLMCALTDTIIP